MSWLKEQTGLLGGFLRADFRVVLRLCALTLALSALVGFAIAYAAPEVVDKVLEAFMNQIQEAGVVDETGELSVFALLMNNWRAMLTSAIWGLIPFLFLPVLSMPMCAGRAPGGLGAAKGRLSRFLLCGHPAPWGV